MAAVLMPPVYDAPAPARPVPRQQRGKAGDFVIVDAGKHISEPGLRIDAIQARGLNQRVHHRCPLAAAVRTAEQP
jgi:hypothetical protein